MPEIELKKIRLNPLNPRLEFSEQGLRQLTDSIRQVGVIEPIIVRPAGDGNYEIVLGERRYRAAQRAKLSKIPVIVRSYGDDVALALNVIENIQREDLSVVEKARACHKLREECPQKYPSWETVAQKLGVDVHTLQGWMRTLELPKPVQRLIGPKAVERVPRGKIDYQTAVRITRKVKEPGKQLHIAREFAKRRVSWRAARKILEEVAKKPRRSLRTVVREVVEEAPIYLPFSNIHSDAIIRRTKTQTSRKSKDPRLRAGTVVRAQVTHFADLKVIYVTRKRLGEFDETDAKREGGYTLREFKNVWKQLHGIWDPNERVHVIQFRLLKVIGEES